MDAEKQRELTRFMVEGAVYIYRHFGITDKGEFMDMQSIAFDAAARAVEASRPEKASGDQP